MLLTNLLTYSMQHSTSWEANRFAASQEIPCILYDPKVHYRSRKCPPPAPTAISGSLSPRHGASSVCGWRNGLQYVG